MQKPQKLDFSRNNFTPNNNAPNKVSAGSGQSLLKRNERPPSSGKKQNKQQLDPLPDIIVLDD